MSPLHAKIISILILSNLNTGVCPAGKNDRLLPGRLQLTFASK